MLHLRQDDFSPILQQRHHRRGHKIESLGGATGENHLLSRGRVDIPCHLIACGLLQVRGFLREEEHPSMDIGLMLVIHPLDSLDHLTRGLGCRRVVEIDQRFAVDSTGKYRIIAPERFNIEHSQQSVKWFISQLPGHGMSRRRHRRNSPRIGVQADGADGRADSPGVFCRPHRP